ncbi:MAG: efflux RND transporter periplasmic adaptor subunit [Oscillatoriales cyanobacterium SM2_2_1]|nr:efflux RND transporter periplasmic adaptor subunit [Oscillatoriales cyanobacterium SM2_2_1]
MDIKATEPKRQWGKWALVTALIVASGGWVAMQFRGEPRAVGLADTTIAVTQEPLALRIRASGSITPIQTVNLSPKQSGILAELLVEQGDRVRRGQVIARMDASNIEPQVNQAQATLLSAEANLARLRNGPRLESIAALEARVIAAQSRIDTALSRLNLATIRAARFSSLQREGAINRDRLDEVLTEERNARADLNNAQASLLEQQRILEESRNGSRFEDIAQAEAQRAQAEASLQAAQVQLEDTTIRAPFDGIITQKYANSGAFVTPTTSASATNSATSSSIVAIAQGLEILARVPEVDVRAIRVGQSVEITADAFPDQTFRGRVRLIAPEAVLEQNVTSFQVRVSLDTGREQLRSGMNTDLRFVGQTIPDALTVPTVAIVTENSKNGVLVPDESGKPTFREVTLGTSVDNRTQILSGLQAGDRVFVRLPEARPR